jgi:putative ABC transport system ATP-binding protein
VTGEGSGTRDEGRGAVVDGSSRSTPGGPPQHHGGTEASASHHHSRARDTGSPPLVPRPSSLLPAVSVRDLRRDYRMGGETVHAVRGVTFDVVDGEYVAVVGPSGCGKSTLLNLVGVIDRPSGGVVAVRGRDVSTMTDKEATLFRLRNVGFVFQRFYLMPTLSARENVELPMAEAKVPRAERGARARELLEYVGLGARERHRPSQLSGGEQQRVAIARALANRPALLLADEPTGELDARTGEEIIRLFGRLNADGTTIVVVTHDEELARAAQRVIHMRDGEITRDEWRVASGERPAGGPPPASG